MIINQVGALPPTQLSKVSRYTGLDVTKSPNPGDVLHIRGEAGPSNNGPWTVFQEVQIYGGPSWGPSNVITISAQIPDDPNFTWGRLNVIEVVGNWTVTPSIT